MKNHYRFLLIFFTLVFAALACDMPAGSPYLYEEDFSNPSGDWAEDRTDGITDFDQDGYRIKVDLDSYYYWSGPGLDFENVIVTVETTKLGGPDDNEFGVICRYVDANNFYFFTISSDGYYGITKIVNDDMVLVGMDSMLFSDVINQGDRSKNTLRADCDGTTLRLHVNGTLLVEATDSDLTSGDVGLIAGTFDTPGTDIRFDNMTVADPAKPVEE